MIYFVLLQTCPACLPASLPGLPGLGQPQRLCVTRCVCGAETKDRASTCKQVLYFEAYFLSRIHLRLR